ncbi:MAG: DUF3418 domain-containing protein [Planctomycetaceae bacterium]|jgi:ATP-dependent helicase HrpA|nr:DUF3418 domain-containing protein [Planctomycetaceae bacterium]
MQKSKNKYSNQFDFDLRKRLVESLELKFDSDLPVLAYHEQIVEAIRSNQVLVICGETGSGKSTQLPKMCLEAGQGIRGFIGHTQPRRIAARSVAARIADELKTPIGALVGYKVRFDNKTSQNTLIKLMTDGILLAESQTDRPSQRFNCYDTIIIDEAHERSLNIDFLLGMMKQILQSRNNLKLIITSATIDAQRFADHFTDRKINNGKTIPIIKVEGRSFPIEILYENSIDNNFNDEEEDNNNNESSTDPSTDSSNDSRFSNDSKNSGGNSNLNLNLRDIKSVSRETDLAEISALINAIDKLSKRGSGDILIFLPTERDIVETKNILDRYYSSRDRIGQTEILQLYSRLSTSDQQQIFKKSSYRKIILSTNVAESSLTVPGIRYVIDTGKARISRYSPSTRTQRLPIEPISQASADQRAGRCGRIGAGICIRLYSQQDYLQRPRYTSPEILRTNLASVILQTKTLKLGEIEKFPFIDSPQKSAIADGYKTLFEIGAIDKQNNLLPIGQKLSHLPVDPRIGRMILAAEENDVLSEMLIVAAALEIQDPRERPRDQQNKADAAQEQFLDPKSDFIAYIKLWDFYQNIMSKASGSSLRKACKQYFLSFNRMKEWNDVYQHLHSYAKQSGMKINNRKDDFQELYEPLHKSILCGDLSGIAERKTNIEYNAPASGGINGKFLIWPGSGIRKLISTNSNVNSNDEQQNDQQDQDQDQNQNQAQGDQNNRNENISSSLPSWLVAVERVEIERRYLRTVAKINRSWIEPLADHLIKRTYSDPFWDRETGYVYAFEQATLFGFVIVPRRRVNYGTIQPEIASEIFIRGALVEGEIDSDLEFIQYNKMLMEEAKLLQAKLRRDLLNSDDAIYEFYRSRIPSSLVYDKRSLEKWAKETSPNNLLMSMDDLCSEIASGDLFPDSILSADNSRTFDLEYKFSLGELDDGVTVILHREELRQVEHSTLGWLVPGLVEQKVIALLKSLPKELRRQIVPIPDTAREIVKRLDFGDGDLEKRLSREVSKVVGRVVSVSDFNVELLPSELRMNIRVIDGDGKILGESRDLDLLRREFGTQDLSENLSFGDSRWNRSGLTKWDFGELPEFVLVERGKDAIKAFPMISGDSFCLTDSMDVALRESCLGIARLFYLRIKREIKSQMKWAADIDKLRIYAGSIPNFNFDDDVGMLTAARAIQIDIQRIPRNEVEFESVSKAGEMRLGISLQEVFKVLNPLLTEFNNARLSIENLQFDRMKDLKADAKLNLLRLVECGFLLRTDFQILREYPRYFKAIQARMEKLKTGNESSDRLNMQELSNYWQRYEERLELHKLSGIIDPELQLFRWMIEEYKVSLYAQQLGTSIKVSPQRLEKQFEKIKK